MGCCRSKNKVEPVPHEPSQSNRQNQTAMQENESSNRELKTDEPVSNESEMPTQNTDNSGSNSVINNTTGHESKSNVENGIINENTNTNSESPMDSSDKSNNENLNESSKVDLSQGKILIIKPQNVYIYKPNTSSSSNSESNVTNNKIQQKFKSMRKFNPKNQKKNNTNANTKESKKSANNEKIAKIKPTSSNKSDNGKLKKSKVPLSDDSSKDDVSQGKDDKTTKSQNNDSLGKQKNRSKFLNKSVSESDNEQMNNQTDNSNNQSIKRPDNNNKSNTDSEDGNRISFEPIRETDNSQNIDSDNQSTVGTTELPQNYVLFKYGIKLKSHNSKNIMFETNPLVMEFEIPSKLMLNISFWLKTTNNRTISDAVFSQINPENSNTIVQVATPTIGRFSLLILKIDRDNLVHVDQIFLTRTESDNNDTLKFCKVYPRGRDCFIYSPIEYYLTSDSFYEFKYFIKDALEVAFLDSFNKWSYLEPLIQEPNNWVLIKDLIPKGRFTLYATFHKNKNLYKICYYEVK